MADEPDGVRARRSVVPSVDPSSTTTTFGHLEQRAFRLCPIRGASL